MQVQFKTDQTEALLTVIIVRPFGQLSNPLYPCFLPCDCRDQTHMLFQKKERGEEKTIISMLTKQGSHPWDDGLYLFIMIIF